VSKAVENLLTEQQYRGALRQQQTGNGVLKLA
jgi:hypothetical protein